jgi:23S rRNA-/tRNA-specific pseudouridylate synthase
LRLDQAIAARFPDISRRKARELIAAGRVLVNEHPVRIASRDVPDDAQITVAGETPALAVIASTEEWIAIDKPVGLPTQPTRDRATLSAEEILRLQYRQIFLVHRLDTPVSGVVLFARTRGAAAKFSELFATGAIRKTYLARIEGRVENPSHIDTPIDGKEALTIVRPLHGALVEVEIKTGRTHQIRRHLASIGHPVAGDTRYGGAPAERLMLHAWKLEHASIGTLEAPPPIHFALHG